MFSLPALSPHHQHWWAQGRLLNSCKQLTMIVNMLWIMGSGNDEFARMKWSFTLINKSAWLRSKSSSSKQELCHQWASEDINLNSQFALSSYTPSTWSTLFCSIFMQISQSICNNVHHTHTFDTKLDFLPKTCNKLGTVPWAKYCTYINLMKLTVARN